jgi:uncharacterized protein YbaR (Trm112 family)
MEITLCCPACKSGLATVDSKTLHCKNCGKDYPVSNGIPVLIDEEHSVFSIADYTENKNPSANPGSGSGLKAKLLRAIHFLQKIPPSVTLNLKAKKNYSALAELLLKKTEKPKVLVIGGRTVGEGMEDLMKLPFTFVETDVAFGPQTKIICDAHSLPFSDNTFDGVIIQAVLEYLVDPYACVAEIHRVLKDDMPVYAETPFLQPVHGREYDFTRFTHLGFCRLFRHFEEIESGACVGTGSALGMTYKYFILSFSDRKIVREFLLLFANYTGFIYRYLDYITINKAATLDAASGYYFLGLKSNQLSGDRDLLKRYRGML